MEDLTKVGFVLSLSPTGTKDVIQIGEDNGDALKNAVHQPLECLGSNLNPEGHVEELPEPEGSDDGPLENVCRTDRNLVAAMDQIYFEKYLLAHQATVKSCMLGKKHLSSTVAFLRHRKSSQGL